MSEQGQNERTQAQTGGQAGDESPSTVTAQPGEDSPGGERGPSYRRMEEDETALKETERTGEGTGARAGDYS